MKVKFNPNISMASNPGYDWIFAAYLDYLKTSQAKSLRGNLSNTDLKQL